MVKARVFAEDYPSGRAWIYEVTDLTLPTGYQIRITGVQHTWRSAMDEACDSLKRMHPIRSSECIQFAQANQ